MSTESHIRSAPSTPPVNGYWVNEWNKRVMRDLKHYERALGRKLKPDEILTRVKTIMDQYGIKPDFVHYKALR